MANSSDWIGAVAFSDRPAPGWIALLDEAGDFREAFPFGHPAAEALSCPSARMVPEPDPAADALARAFADGEATGRMAAEAAADTRAEAAATRQRSLRLAFRTLDQAARDVLAEDLADTVMALCDAALAGAAIDRDALIARCHAAARRIGGAAEALTLHLHPEDIAALDAEALAGWQVIPDPALERGGVLIEGADGAVSDGPVEWRRAIAAGLRG